MVRRFALIAVLVLCVPSPAPAAVTDSVRADADWLLSVQASNGMITQGIDKTWCVPYFANIGARGLAHAYTLTREDRYANAGWSYLSWYSTHMNVQGFITDYRLSNGAWSSTGGYDSTDSYAATFLSAVDDLWKATGDDAHLLTLKAAVTRASRAIDATTDAADGLTYAKPGWGWKYLMDNAEVYEGWKAAADVAIRLGDLTLQQKATSRAAQMQSSVRALWNPAEGGYDWGLSDIGAHARLDWSQFYPSAVAQGWAVFSGLVTGAQASSVMAKLDASQPSWDQPSSTSQIVDHSDRIGYWPAIARAFLEAGNATRAASGSASIENTAASARRYWPFHPGAAGALLLVNTDARLTVGLNR